MQISRVQSFNQTNGAQSGNSAAKNGRADNGSNPFSLASNGYNNGSAESNLNNNQEKNKNKGNQNNPNDMARDERVKQLQVLIETQQRELDKLQEAFQNQLSNVPQGDGALRAEKTKAFQFSMGAKANQIGQLQQQLSQEMASGSIGGFVGQQAGGMGISLSVKA